LLNPKDVVLAYKQADLLDEGAQGLVMVVRHDASNGEIKNPCEILLLQKNGSAFAVTNRNATAVDCTYNAIQKNAEELALNDNLRVKPLEITYVNQQTKGNSQYTFVYSKAKSAWHLQMAVATFPENDEATGQIRVVRETLSYPQSLGWLTLASFDPEQIEDALESHREFVP
jgi:hypothetical protein